MGKRPNVFLSYANEQQEYARQLEFELTAKGIDAWRDKTQLHAGECWPKKLGDAIAGSDAVILLWSAQANQSDLVELEWTIAVGLKKPIVSCFLDETALPSILNSSHCIADGDVQQAGEQIMGALKNLPPSVSSNQHDKLLETLAAAPVTEPQPLIQHIHTIVNQPSLSVGGNIYQVQGNIHIGTAQLLPTKKSLVERWKTWVGLMVGILTIPILFVQLQKGLPVGNQDKSQKEIHRKTEITEPGIVEQVLEGLIRDKNNELLEGVKVTLPRYFPQPGSTDVTDQFGRFQLTAKAGQEAYVEFQAEKDGFIRYEDDLQLGATTLSFTMKRNSP
ncbi:MAG: TIR domain-containing protein [Nitrospirales bacterium]|nr:TIR domain-containing protein [Nitrospirales bacterium]